MIFFKIDLDEVRDTLGIVPKKWGCTEPQKVCLLCGKKIKSKNHKSVHLTTDGYLVPTDIDVEDSQGLFPVGNDCAKKLKSLISITT